MRTISLSATGRLRCVYRPDMYLGLEIFYIGLLVLAVIAILSVSAVVLYNLFRGQR